MASATGNIVVIERDSLDYMEKEQIQFDDSEYYNMRVNKPQTLRFDRSKMGRLFEEIFFAGFLPMIVYFSSLFFLSTSLLRRNIPNAGTWIARILAVLVAVALVLWPAGSLKKSTWDIRKTKVMEWKAVTFLWYQLLCFLVVGIFSIVYADTMYTEYVMPYQNYLDKKWIEQPISPLLQSGQNFQDAGVVSFSADSYIDRAHNACFRGAGVSYCVVPIVQDTAGTGDRTRLPSSPTGSYDYFAVGTDCCSCPGTGDFQCGDWDFSESMGGLRQLEMEQRAFYQLAVEQWEAAWNKDSKTPLFFHWKNKPYVQMKYLRDDFSTSIFMTTLTLLAVLLFVACAQNQIRSMIYESYEQEWLSAAANAREKKEAEHGERSYGAA